MLDHACEQIHGGDLSLGGNAQAPGRMEMHLARRLDLELPRLPAPPRGRLPVCAREGTGERLVGRVARVECDREHVVVRGDQPVRRPLEQHAAPQRRRRFTGGGRHEPVEVEPGQVHPRRELVGRRVVIVEHVRQGIDKAGEGVGRHAHRPDPARGGAGPLDRACGVRIGPVGHALGSGSSLTPDSRFRQAAARGFSANRSPTGKARGSSSPRPRGSRPARRRPCACSSPCSRASARSR